jgi:SOS-response transcriptional repressor LexA
VSGIVAENKGERVLRFIAEQRRKKGWAPTVRETGRACGMTSTGHVDYYLKELEKAGLIYREPSPRCIRLTRDGRAFLEGDLA